MMVGPPISYLDRAGILSLCLLAKQILSGQFMKYTHYQ